MDDDGAVPPKDDANEPQGFSPVVWVCGLIVIILILLYAFHADT